MVVADLVQGIALDNPMIQRQFIIFDLLFFHKKTPRDNILHYFTTNFNIVGNIATLFQIVGICVPQCREVRSAM
jgi:hypothetical protein